MATGFYAVSGEDEVIFSSVVPWSADEQREMRVRFGALRFVAGGSVVYAADGGAFLVGYVGDRPAKAV